MKNKTLIAVILIAAILTEAAFLRRSLAPSVAPPPMPPTNYPIAPAARFRMMSGEADPLITNQHTGTITLRLTIKTLNCEFANPPGSYAGPVPSTFSYTNTNVVTMTTSGWGGGSLVFTETDIPDGFPEDIGFGVQGYCPIRAISKDATCLQVSGKAKWANGDSTNWTVVANLPGGTQSFHWLVSLGCICPLSQTNEVLELGASITDYSIDAFAPRPPTINPPTVVPNTNGPAHRTPSGNPYNSYVYETTTDIGTNENWVFIPPPGVMQIGFYPDSNLTPGSTWNILATAGLSRPWTNVDSATADGQGFVQVFEDAPGPAGYYRISP